MIPQAVECPCCGAVIDVRTYRKFVQCPYCGIRTPFDGFEYENIDWRSSMYAHVKLWMDCPACRSGNMYLGPSGKVWHCPDCGYRISRTRKNTCVFWFCDDCETFLNVQDGFTTKNKTWTCTECGYNNEVTRGNII